jgi:hypothetical protein
LASGKWFFGENDEKEQIFGVFLVFCTIPVKILYIIGRGGWEALGVT